jgi:DNA primase
MAMHAAGVTTAVASCGTAFGEDHLQILRRLMLDDNYFRGELIYTFDGDEAGQKAAMRAFEGDQKFTGQSFVAVAPEGMDPCDLRLQRGDAAVRDLVADRIPMFQFVIESMLAEHNLDTVEGRLQALRRTVPVVAGIKDPVLQGEYARQLAGWVGWANTEEVLQQVRAEARRPKQEPKRRAVRFDKTESAPVQTPAFEMPNPRDPYLWPQRESLKLALQYPELAGTYFDGLGPDAFTHPAYRTVRQAIRELGGLATAHSGVDWIATVAAEMTDLLGRNLVSELAVEEIPVEMTNLAAYADSVLSRLQEAEVGNQIAQLKSQLQRMRPSDDEQAYNTLFADLVALEQARRELNDRAFRGIPAE